MPERVVRAAVCICGDKFEERNAVRRFVRRREGVGEEDGMVAVVRLVRVWLYPGS